MDESEKLKICSGCYNDFYNNNNPYGVKRCWSLKDATIVFKKEVHINQIPPFKQKPIKKLSCYRRPQYVYIDANKEY